MKEALTKFVTENEALIYSVIKRYSSYAEIEDLYQVAIIGIANAYRNFDPKFNVKFTSYAYNYILGEVLNYVNTSKLIKVSRSYKEQARKITELITLLTQKLMREPTIEEISNIIGISKEEIIYIMESKNQVESLDNIVYNEGNKQNKYDMIPDKVKVDDIERIFLYEEIEKLEKDEQIILKERYFSDKTQSEVAESLGVNQVWVSRTEGKILKKLRDKLVA